MTTLLPMASNETVDSTENYDTKHSFASEEKHLQ